MSEKNEVQVVTPAELQLIQEKRKAQFEMTPMGQEMRRFEIQNRMAAMYAQSTIIPDAYRNNVGNCVIAVDMAMRMNAGILMVMQNLDTIKGKPSFSAKFLIATINASGRFTPIRYEFRGKEGDDSWACRVVAYEASDRDRKEPLYGTWISIKMAKDEGWYQKDGSKWKTMPEQMLSYRAAAFWQRLYCPEISMGLMTTEEYEDMADKRKDYMQEIEEEANKRVLQIEGERKQEAEPADSAEADGPGEVAKPASEEKPLEARSQKPSFMQ